MLPLLTKSRTPRQHNVMFDSCVSYHVSVLMLVNNLPLICQFIRVDKDTHVPTQRSNRTVWEQGSLACNWHQELHGSVMIPAKAASATCYTTCLHKHTHRYTYKSLPNLGHQCALCQLATRLRKHVKLNWPWKYTHVRTNRTALCLSWPYSAPTIKNSIRSSY